MAMMPFTAAFQTPTDLYYADTCTPLKAAVARGELQLVARARDAYPGLPLPDNSILEVRSVGYWDANRSQSWGLDWHRNEGIELTYVARGQVGFAVDQQSYQLKRGDLTITRPWQRHCVGNPSISACQLHWLILDVGVRRPNQPWEWPAWLVLTPDDIACLTTLLSYNEQPVWNADDEVAFYFEQLGVAVANYDQPLGESRLKLHINGLLLALTTMLRRRDLPLDRSLSSTLRAVELFLGELPQQLDHPWTLNEMAATCGLARSRFSYYCKVLTNMSPAEYLAHCRVQAAGVLLSQCTDTSITEIAMRCGFSSSQYFAKVFHKQTGQTPREYRTMQRAARLATGDS